MPCATALEDGVSKLTVKCRRIVCPFCGTEGAYAVFKRHTRSKQCTRARLEKKIIELKAELERVVAELNSL